MERVPEPELMDEEAQARAYAEADFEEPHNRFVALFGECFPDWQAADRSVLDLGCGPADITIRFAAAHPDCRIVGLDGAPRMLQLGERAVSAAGLAHRVHFIQGYLPGADLSRSRYDAVISNSLLHHLADPAVLWHAVVQHGKPGAAVFVMDLVRPETPEAVDRMVRDYAAGEPPILQHDFRASLRAAYRPEEVAEQIRPTGLDLRVEQVSDRHLIAWGSR